MITVAVLTVSDSTADGTREDVSGPAVAEHAAQLGWTVVERAVVSDDVLRHAAFGHGMPQLEPHLALLRGRAEPMPVRVVRDIERELAGVVLTG